MELRYLFDTSVIIKYLNEQKVFSEKALNYIDKIIDKKLQISVITKIELQSKVIPQEENIKINLLLSHSKIFEVSESIADKAAELRRKFKLKTPDAIIAATAIIYECTLLADNDKDFKQLETTGLILINPKNVV